MAKTLKDVQKLIKDEGIRMVDFKLTDIDGRCFFLSAFHIFSFFISDFLYYTLSSDLCQAGRLSLHPLR